MKFNYSEGILIIHRITDMFIISLISRSQRLRTRQGFASLPSICIFWRGLFNYNTFIFITKILYLFIISLIFSVFLLEITYSKFLDSLSTSCIYARRMQVHPV